MAVGRRRQRIVRNWLAPFTEVEMWEAVSGRGVRREDEDLREGQEGVSRTELVILVWT